MYEPSKDQPPPSYDKHKGYSPFVEDIDPPQDSYPPPQSAYPPEQGAYPPTQSAYPPVQGAYPPTQSAYPPTQSAYPLHKVLTQLVAKNTLLKESTILPKKVLSMWILGIPPTTPKFLFLWRIMDSPILTSAEYELTEEEYVFGALTLYIDVIQLFLRLLSCTGRR
ncbi:hypothetical protein ACHWQZ_G015632 [Mnemiopsis leidyi]